MKKLFSRLIRTEMFESIPEEDLMSRQRFTLFRIFSYTGILASLATAIQIYSNFNQNNFTATMLFFLSAVLAVNFFAVKNVAKLRLAYSITLFTGFLVVHIQAYNAGGLMNSGTIYVCVLIMAAFMLLGPKSGKIFTLVAIINVIYFYVITNWTGMTSYDLLSNKPELIYQDALMTFSFGLFLVAAQSNYLNSGKNVIIQRITLQKDQLEKSNVQLKDYANNLEKTNKELDKFASIVSHDLKAPLRAIGNLTGWIEEDAGDLLQGELKANFELIKQRVKRMEDLINGILEYSRADRRETADVKIESAKLIGEVIEFIGKPENLHLKIQDEMPVVFTDRVRLFQVFSNLIENSIKYNDKPEVNIEVNCETSNEGWIFSVKDNGPGIEKQYHEKIFIIFQTLNRRDDVESTGVGLAIVKKIIEDQGGKIWVESEQGKGADFKFFWPRVKKAKDPLVIAATIIV